MPDKPSTSERVRCYPIDVSFKRKLKAELRIIGNDFKHEDVERLKKQLLAVIETLEEAFID